MKKNKQDDFSVFQRKIAIRFFGSAVLSVLIVVAIYLFLWKRRLGDFIVYLLEFFLQMEHEEAFLIYHNNFRGYKEIFFTVAIITIFLLLLLFLFRWITRYFKEINGGIDNLLEDDESKICLSREMLPFQCKLNTVKRNLRQQKEATALAEQRNVGLEDLSLEDFRSLDARIGEDIYPVLDCHAAVRRRETPGGTGPKSVQAQLELLRSWLNSRG